MNTVLYISTFNVDSRLKFYWGKLRDDPICTSVFGDIELMRNILIENAFFISIGHASTIVTENKMDFIYYLYYESISEWVEDNYDMALSDGLITEDEVDYSIVLGYLLEIARCYFDISVSFVKDYYEIVSRIGEDYDVCMHEYNGKHNTDFFSYNSCTYSIMLTNI